MKLPFLLTRILLVLVVSTSMSSCSILGPHADAVLLDLAQQADNDAAMTRDPDFKMVRARQAVELKEEITRLCGLRPDGSPYLSCAEDLSHPASYSAEDTQNAHAITSSEQASSHSPSRDTSQWTQAARRMSNDVDKVPEESRELVAREAIELASYASRSDSEPSRTSALSSELLANMSSSDQTILEEVLRREYATVYYLGLALGYLDDSHTPTYQAILLAHQRCVDELNTAFSRIPVTIVPELSYELGGYPQPQDDASALSLGDAVNNDATHQLHLAASQVSSDKIRWWLVSYAGLVGAEVNSQDSTQPGPAQ